jgi:hypothetical protein
MAIAARIFRWLSSVADGLFPDWDGLDSTAFVEHIEHEFQINVQDEDAARLQTLGELCSFVLVQRRAQGRPLEDEMVWQAVRRITSEEMGVHIDELHRGTRYVEDLLC